MFFIIISIAPFQNYINYKIDAEFVESLNIIKASEIISYINNSNDTLDHLELNLYANAFRPYSKYDKDLIKREKNYEIRKSKPKDQGYIRIDSCSQTFDTNDMLMKIYKRVMPKETVEIKMKFTLKIPKLFDRLGKADSEYEITQWYPKMGVYDERGWRTYGYRYNTEFYGDYANWRVSIKLPKRYIVGSSGFLVDSVVNDSFKQLTFELEKAHDFALVFGPRYKVYVSDFNNIKIYILTYSNDTNFVRISKTHSVNSLKLFSNYLYPYPYKSLTVVESHLRAGGGMEYPALVLITNTKPKRFINFIDFDNIKSYYLAIVIAHEVGHQWFYGIIGNDEAYEAWMDEGMNSYLEDYYNHIYFSNDSIYRLMGKFSKIMKFYLNDYDFRLLSDFYYYLKPYDEPLIGKPAWEMKNYWQVYNRGKNIMYALKEIMGDSVFDVMLKNYFKEFAFRHPRSEDFFYLAQNYTHYDLKNFKNLWLYGKGLPNYSIYRLDGEVLIKSSSYYQYPVSILCSNQVLKIKPDTIIKTNDEVLIDPYYHILESDEWDNSDRRKLEWKPFFTFPKIGYYQISFIPFIFYNPFDKLLFGAYFNGSESHKRHFVNYWVNTKGDIIIKYKTGLFMSSVKYTKSIFSSYTGLNLKNFRIFIFNENINDLSFLEPNYFEKENTYGLAMSGKYGGFYGNFKLGRNFKNYQNYAKLKLGYKNEFLEKLEIHLIYNRIIGDYPIQERIYIDGGFYYPDFVELLMPYRGEWFYSRNLTFNEGLFSIRGQAIYNNELFLGDLKFKLLRFIGIYTTLAYTNHLLSDYGAFLNLGFIEFRIINPLSSLGFIVFIK